MRASQDAIAATQGALNQLVEEVASTSRAGYLRTLEERIVRGLGHEARNADSHALISLRSSCDLCAG